MSTLLHISASPRGGASESLQIANTFAETYRETHPDAKVQTWDLWDGTLPEFGSAAAGAKMTIFGGGVPEGPYCSQHRNVSVMHCITETLRSTFGSWRSRGQRVPTSTGSRTRTQSTPSQTRTTSRSSSTNRSWRQGSADALHRAAASTWRHLLEVMVELIPPRCMHIFHVMQARQKHLDRMGKDPR